MKYIRTKYYAYELISDINDKGFNVKVKTRLNYSLVPKATIIGNPVDTIQELCDCYSYNTETTKDYLVARSWKLHNKEREIFGCIKTAKGLIYIARMNNEGELELL